MGPQVGVEGLGDRGEVGAQRRHGLQQVTVPGDFALEGGDPPLEGVYGFGWRGISSCPARGVSAPPGHLCCGFESRGVVYGGPGLMG
jgi:hypothetical protein